MAEETDDKRRRLRAGRARATSAPRRAAPRSAAAEDGAARLPQLRTRSSSIRSTGRRPSRKSWSVDLRCPDCEWHGGGVYAQEIVDRFDEALDRGTEQLLGDLSLLTRANMEEQVERFVTALNAGWILPEDF